MFNDQSCLFLKQPQWNGQRKEKDQEMNKIENSKKKREREVEKERV